MRSSAFYVLRAELVRQESLGRESHGREMWEYHRGMQCKNAFSLLLYLSSVPLSYISIYLFLLCFCSETRLVLLPEGKLAAFRA